MGHGEILDHMFYDGLQSPGTASSWAVSRMPRPPATTSARAAGRLCQRVGAARAARGDVRDFDAEVTPLTVKSRQRETVVARDETPGTCDVSKISALKPAFGKDGTVTAASSSSIADGAAALVLMSAAAARERGAKPLARLLAYASHAQEPEWFTTAPGAAIKKVLTQLAGNRTMPTCTRSTRRSRWSRWRPCTTSTLIMRGEHQRRRVRARSSDRATGARILTTLVHALRHRGAKRGIASLCIGGGEAVAAAVKSSANHGASGAA